MNGFSKFALLTIGSTLVYGVALADPTWVGTADYQNAPGGTVSNADDVGPFNTFSFAAGSPVLIQGVDGSDPQDVALGNQLAGYFQTYVTGMLLNGVTVASPNLNVTGASGPETGYDLTLAASFSETVTGVTASTATFDITGGTVNLNFNPKPDYDFTTDNGFTDGSPIFSGTIIGGSGSIVNGSVGVTSVDVKVNSYDASVFNPADLSGGSSIFSLSLISPTSAGAVSGVLGHTVDASTDILATATGDLVLAAVPEPQPWMMMPVGLVIATLAARRKYRT